MRFYEINIFEENKVIKNYSSHKNGVYNPRRFNGGVRYTASMLVHACR